MNKTLELLLKTDVYKVSHRTLYPKGLEIVFSNFTPRAGNWANPDLGFVVAHGMRYVVDMIRKEFDKYFFNKPPKYIDEVIKQYELTICKTLNIASFDANHFRELYKLGELPLEFRAVKEGSHIKYKTPILTIYNTDKRFAWLVNYLETWISSELWPIVTASTRAYAIKQQLIKWANKTGTPLDFVDFQAHDFSFRGMEGSHGAKLSGIGHLQHFSGSDNLPAILACGKGNSVVASEHSVMSAGTKEGEFETYKRLINDNPGCILSLVSDTWNIYNVCDNILPKLKSDIERRAWGDNNFVIRPDSGDAVKVLLGGQELTHPNATDKDRELAKLGLFKIIEKHFGYKTNEKGYKVLPIGFLWGDGMLPHKIDELFDSMEKAGYSSQNVIIGVGSYTYQLVTRDTYAFAMKATYVEINGKDYEITKDPITDSGVKKSAKGLLAIINGELVEQTTWDIVKSKENELEIV